MSSDKIVLRPLTIEDAELVFKWRNDPTLIKLSSLQRSVPWEEHKQWILETTQLKKRMSFIINRNDYDCGQLRFDRLDNQSCVISIYLISDFTGLGIGTIAVREGIARLRATWASIDFIWAFVRLENEAGKKLFLRSGFEQKESSFCPAGHISYCYQNQT